MIDVRCLYDGYVQRGRINAYTHSPTYGMMAMRRVFKNDDTGFTRVHYKEYENESI